MRGVTNQWEGEKFDSTNTVSGDSDSNDDDNNDNNERDYTGTN